MVENVAKFIDNLIEELAPICIKIVFALLILIVGLFLVKTLVKFLRKSKGFSKINDSAGHFLLSFIKIALNIIVIFSAAIVLGFPAASIVTVLATAGAAVGLALQGSLSNLAGGIMIVIFKPFKIGDFIVVGDNSGTVKDISVFYTTIVTLDNKQITLPNGNLTNSAITNCSANPKRRVDFTFSVAYDSDIDKVKSLLKAAADENDNVIDKEKIEVHLAKHNDSSLDFVLFAWCSPSDYWAVFYSITERVKQLFDENNVEIPYPQMDVHLDK